MDGETRGRQANLVVGGAVFLGAFLLFALELVIGKAALPRFGGTAAVWTTCLVFFQAALLAGYGYSHLVVTRLGAAAQRGVHLAVLTLVVAVLGGQVVAWGWPLLPPRATGSIDAGAVLVFLLLSAGAPFFVLSTTGPLLQAWYARTSGASPWWLYALSNAGSLAALLVYPFVLEPLVGLRAQAAALSIAWLGWGALLVAGARTTHATAKPAMTTVNVPHVRPREAATWVALSAMGTLFLSAVNNVLCQDVAPTPFLWALPLAVYLASFVVAFDERRRVGVLGTQLWLAGLVAVILNDVRWPDVPLAVTVGAWVLVQAGASLLCHGELFARRPPPERLSSFYLWSAVGGALGSLLVGVVAPVVLSDFHELPVALVLVGVGVAIALVRRAPGQRTLVAVASVVLALGAAFVSRALVSGERLAMRNFFGVLRVQEEGAPGHAEHAFGLRHGGTLHGMQFTHPARIDEPTTYYSRSSGVGHALRVLRERRGGALSVSVLGLGVGTMAALLEAGDRADFVDIDPNVVALARGEGGYFLFLERTRATVTTTVGDARQVLEASTEPRDLIAVDVFSGDAVPAHLFTVEAFRVYLSRLRDDGVLALHVSNRHLRLGRVAMGIAKELGLEARIVISRTQGLGTSSTWVLVAKDARVLDAIRADADGIKEIVREVDSPVVWTDDAQSLLPVLRLR